MTFGEKLDLLISIANVTNSELARNVGLDASFVSRLRRGERPPSKNQNYLGPMAAYFAACTTSDIQKLALGEVLGVRASELQDDAVVFADRIASWLLENEQSEISNVENFLFQLSFPAAKNTERSIQPDHPSHGEIITEPHDAVFYGISGKQRALTAFLTMVLKSEKPVTLMLYSSEDVEWLIHDKQFTSKWSVLLGKLITMGCRIKIIHTVKRGPEDMLASIREWLPVYMTGAIEPYYNPMSREEVFGRTMMIAPGIAAVNSSSIGKGARNAANFLYTDPGVIDALAAEFNDFLGLCRPLMKIFTESDVSGYSDMITEFENFESRGIIKTDSLSCMTMPMEIAERMCFRKEPDSCEDLLYYHRSRINGFESRLKKCGFSEIIKLPCLEELMSGSVCTGFCDTPSYVSYAYTPEDYRGHLLNIVRLLESCPNYHVCLTPESVMPGSLIYVKEREGVIVVKTARPAVIFAISETAITEAFVNYLNRILKKTAEAGGPDRRRKTIAALRKYIDSISPEETAK